MTNFIRQLYKPNWVFLKNEVCVVFQSGELNNLFEALSKAQGEFESLPFNRVNPHFKSKFADLAITQEKTRPVLAKYGLSVLQLIASEGEEYFISTTLTHSSGQYVGSKVKLILFKKDMQGLGSAVTYAKRYAWQSILGLCGDDDDDGNQASGKGKDPKDEPKGAPKEHPKFDPKLNHPSSPELMEQLETLINLRGVGMSEINHLVTNGFKYSGPRDQLPSFIAEYIVKLLADESANSATIMGAAQRLKNSFDAAALVNPPKQKEFDPADFVMPMGSQDVKGKKLRELPEKTLTAIYDWAEVELGKKPDLKKQSALLEVKREIKSFLKSMGVD